jgi:hypothetical protein
LAGIGFTLRSTLKSVKDFSTGIATSVTSVTDWGGTGDEGDDALGKVSLGSALACPIKTSSKLTASSA